MVYLCLQRRRGPGEHSTMFVWPSQLGNMWRDHKCLFAVCTLAWAVQVRAVQRARCELLDGWYTEHLCPLQLSSKEAGQCFIKLSVHGHPGPPLQILCSKKRKKKNAHLAEHSWALQPWHCNTERTDAAMKATKFLTVFWRDFPGRFPN